MLFAGSSPVISTTSVFDPAGGPAKAGAGLFTLIMVLMVVVVLMISFLVSWAGFKFRDHAGRENFEPRQSSGNFKLEIAWTVGPALLLVFLFIPTVIVMDQADPPVPANAQANVDVEIIGHQWWWEYRYPKYGFTTANEMYMPAGTNFLAKLESADVIHEFWVPQLGPEFQNIPGSPVYQYLEADKPDQVLHGACSQYCGTQHAWMLISVHVVTPDAFKAWAASQQKASTPPASVAAAATTTPSTGAATSSNSGCSATNLNDAVSNPACVAAGYQVYLNNTCVNCHAIAGTTSNAIVGPNLTHLASRQIIGSGIRANTAQNLAAWVRNANDIKPGVHMPSYSQLSDTDINNLVAYLESLK